MVGRSENGFGRYRRSGGKDGMVFTGDNPRGPHRPGHSRGSVGLDEDRKEGRRTMVSPSLKTTGGRRH